MQCRARPVPLAPARLEPSPAIAKAPSPPQRLAIISTLSLKLAVGLVRSRAADCAGQRDGANDDQQVDLWRRSGKQSQIARPKARDNEKFAPALGFVRPDREV